jgi:hypothetical protein
MTSNTNNSNIFVLPILASILYFAIRVLENHYQPPPQLELDDVRKPMKLIVRDTFLVFICSMIANGAMMIFHGHAQQLFHVVTETKSVLPELGQPKVFTDIPEF